MTESNREHLPETPELPGSPIRDRAVRPAGLLPKNTQAYVILGLAVVMVGAIAFSGAGTPLPGKSGPAAPKPAPVIDPNLARIQEYRNRIDEQARKLAAEQAQLEHAKQALGLPPAAVPAAGAAGSAYTPPAYPPPSYIAPEPRQEKNPIEADKEKREYQSLFASNIALSYRKDAPMPAQPAGPVAAPSPLVPLPYPPLYLPMPFPSVPGTAAAPPPPVAHSQAESGDRGEAGTQREPGAANSRKSAPEDPALKRAEGKLYRLFEGAIIETVLTNRLNGSFTGPVNCMVTTDVYSHDRQHILIPKGSRLLGEAKRNDSFGHQRLAVFFHRIIMPDGYSVNLDQFRGLNQIGETGLRDQVNHHYGQIFGVSLAVGSLAGLATINTGYGVNASTGDAYRQGVAANLSQSSLRILDRYLNVLPTFTIREGHRIKIYLSGDLQLPAYERHTVPGDL